MKKIETRGGAVTKCDKCGKTKKCLYFSFVYGEKQAVRVTHALCINCLTKLL